jgi:hypothetical protein
MRLVVFTEKEPYKLEVGEEDLLPLHVRAFQEKTLLRWLSQKNKGRRRG